MVKSEKMRLKGRDIIGKKVLILGEVGSGKTKLAANLLGELTTLIDPANITIVDLAPERIGEIGGKITDYVKLASRVRYLSPRNVHTPRLTGTSSEEVLRYAELNRKTMKKILEEFIQNVSEVLVLNDVTLYFHLGELETVLECAKLAKTFLATAYYGSTFAGDLGTGISFREKQLTERLANSMDIVTQIE